jgi:hypothetical protein
MRRNGCFFESNMESCYLSLEHFIVSSKKEFYATLSGRCESCHIFITETNLFNHRAL